MPGSTASACSSQLRDYVLARLAPATADLASQGGQAHDRGLSKFGVCRVLVALCTPDGEVVGEWSWWGHWVVLASGVDLAGQAGPAGPAGLAGPAGPAGQFVRLA